MRSLWGCQWKGTERREPGQFSNFEYFTTHNYSLVWGGKKKKMDRSGAGWVHACVTGQHHVCLIITPQSSLASLFLPLSSVRLSRSLVKASVANKAHSHAERMWGSTNSHHNYIWFLPYCLSHRLHSPLPRSLPKTLPAMLFFASLHNVSSCLYATLCRTPSLTLMWRPIRALCLPLCPRALSLKSFLVGKRKQFNSSNSSLWSFFVMWALFVCWDMFPLMFFFLYFVPQFATLSTGTLLFLSSCLFFPVPH